MSVTALDLVVDRAAVAGHDGRSGARIERGRLADGTRVYVKVAPLATDLAGLATGSPTRELELFRAGVFDRLPLGVATALLDVEVAGGSVVTVTRDLGGAVLSWDRVLRVAEIRLLLDRATALHRRFAAAPPPGLARLEDRLALLAPARLDAVAAASPEVAAVARRGWEVFGDLVPEEVAAAVDRCHRDPGTLAAVMSTGSATTLLHGDLWLVNAAIEGDVLVLLDWGLATAGPPALDLLTFCIGATSNVDLPRPALVAEARRACGELVEDRAFAAAELWALAELGWNKAADAVDHPEPRKRAVERADLDFWVGRALAALEAGVL